MTYTSDKCRFCGKHAIYHNPAVGWYCDLIDCRAKAELLKQRIQEKMFQPKEKT